MCLQKLVCHKRNFNITKTNSAHSSKVIKHINKREPNLLDFANIQCDSMSIFHAGIWTIDIITKGILL